MDKEVTLGGLFDEENVVNKDVSGISEKEKEILSLREDVKNFELKKENEKQLIEGGKEKMKTYSYEEVLKATTEYFGGDSLAADVWINKYALKDSFGNIYELTPDDMHRRIAREISRIENKYKNPLKENEIYEVLKEFKYIVPQGGPMSGIGNDYQIASLSNCFVIGLGSNADSYGGIMRIDEEQVQLMKRRGGVGHDLSHIRPKGSPVMNSALTSTGIVPFMERYSNSTREVAQDGRRGALMLSLSIRHPDVCDFIDAKLDTNKITGANISVKIDDEFMRAVIEDKEYEHYYPVEGNERKYVKKIRARELWEKIITNAWKSAEPGILFWDTIIRESVADCYADLGFKTVSTNPCGEIPLCPYDSCRLLAINLYSYVKNPFTRHAMFDFNLFAKHAQIAQRIMDDIVDLEIEKIDKILEKVRRDPEDEYIKRNEIELWEKIRNKCIEGRRTGIGITGEGDMLAALGLRYGSEDAINFSVGVHRMLALEVYRSSVKLAYERGPFKVYDSEREKNNPFIRRLKESDIHLYNSMLKYGRRNISLLTIAPTGTTSLMTQTTSGLEPVFMVAYKRRRKVNPNDKDVKYTIKDSNGDTWVEYSVLHKGFIDWLKANNIDVDKVKGMSIEEINKIVEKSPYYKSTAMDIDWVSKVKMQGAIQKWVDHSISVTVNVPNNISVEMVGEIYRTAWESGCKGITIYREGSREGVLVSEKSKSKSNNGLKGEFFSDTDAPKRPKVLEADVKRFQNDKEKWIAVVGLLNGRPYEIFTGRAEGISIPLKVEKGWVIKVKSEGVTRYDFQYVDGRDEDGREYRATIEGLSRSFNKEYWNYARLISGILRHGMPLVHVVNVINNLKLDSESITTWKNGVERVLKTYIPTGTKVKGEKCSNCGSDALVYKEGCVTCESCGHTLCG